MITKDGHLYTLSYGRTSNLEPDGDVRTLYKRFVTVADAEDVRVCMMETFCLCGGRLDGIPHPDAHEYVWEQLESGGHKRELIVSTGVSYWYFDPKFRHEHQTD
jgi:hypothetical protein